MSECVFCDIVRGTAPASRVYEDDATLAFMNIRQGNPGHVLVIPKAHLVTIYDLDAATAARLFQTVTYMAGVLRRVFAPDGLNIWQSNGEAAGQEIPHVHIHLLPRSAGDDLVQFYTQTPPIADHATLDALAARIRAVQR